MPEIQVPELARKLARRFGITGYSPAPTLAPEIVPVAIVENLTDPNEEDTGFERLCIGTFSQANVAGQYSHAQLLNPTGSGIIVNVEALYLHADNATTLRLKDYDTALTTAADAYFRDRRLEGRPGAQVRNQADVAMLGTTLGNFAVATAADTIAIPLDFLLPEGKAIAVVGVTVNLYLYGTFFWSERQRLPAE